MEKKEYQITDCERVAWIDKLLDCPAAHIDVPDEEAEKLGYFKEEAFEADVMLKKFLKEMEGDS